jgi:hypothetical protein
LKRRIKIKLTKRKEGGGTSMNNKEGRRTKRAVQIIVERAVIVNTQSH